MALLKKFASRNDRREDCVAQIETALAEVYERLGKEFGTSGDVFSWAAENEPSLIAALREAEARYDTAWRCLAAGDETVLPTAEKALADIEAALRSLFEAFRGKNRGGEGQPRKVVTTAEKGEGPFPPDHSDLVHVLVEHFGASHQDKNHNQQQFEANGKSARAQITLFETEDDGSAAVGRPQLLQGIPDNPWLAWLNAVEIVQVRSIEEWSGALEKAKHTGVCGFDSETTGLDPLQAQIRLVQLGVPVFPPDGCLVGEDGRSPAPGGGCEVYVLDLWELGENDQLNALRALRDLVADPGVIKAGANLKFDLSFLRTALGGARFAAENLFDCILASQLAWAGYYRLEKTERATKHTLKEVYPSHDLAALCRRHLGVELNKTLRLSDWSGPLAPDQVRYAALDAAVVLPLREILAGLIEKNELAQAAALEFNLIPVTTEFELVGMPFDAENARGMLRRLRTERERLAGELIQVARAAGFRARPKKNTKRYSPDLNPNSSEDVLLALRLVSGREIRDTREETLKDLAGAGCTFAATLLAYRRLDKQEAFVEEWLKSQHPVDDRIHAKYRQLNPRGVGRYSCSDPNLQQTPSRGEDAKVFRSLFRVPEDRVLVIGDYSTIELRAVAAIAGDEAMLTAFREGKDLHRVTAAAIAGKAEEEVSKAERRAAKPVNFGLIYGCGPGRLVATARYDYGVDMSYEQAKTAREAYFQIYRGIVKWHRSQSALRDNPEPHWFHSYERGYYTCRLVSANIRPGRKRVWPNYAGKTVAAVTELFNTPVQGAAASALKRGLIRLYWALLERNWPDTLVVGSVHDEVLVECPEHMGAEVAALLKQEMEEAGREVFPEVPIEFEVVVGKHWADKG